VSQDGKVMILNLNWDVPLARPDQGVWATLQFTLQGAKLRIYDAAPDAPKRTCLAACPVARHREHPFPLKEEVQPLAEEFQRPVPMTEHPLFRLAVGFAISGLFRLVSTML
jgi:hypothetical protein